MFIHSEPDSSEFNAKCWWVNTLILGVDQIGVFVANTKK
jgi:hypothetical protein